MVFVSDLLLYFFNSWLHWVFGATHRFSLAVASLALASLVAEHRLNSCDTQA